MRNEQDWGLNFDVGSGTTDEGYMGVTADEGWLESRSTEII